MNIDAATVAVTPDLHLAATGLGWLALAIFVLAYLGVVFEERLQLAKSKPVMLGAALIWGLLAWQVGEPGSPQHTLVRAAFEHMFLE
ncbi:MAG: sodium:proton antiporter, partial [Xanthomonadales bacterium]|nr:sodium:proton antiporter [Xanthomonadales bacterium]